MTTMTMTMKNDNDNDNGIDGNDKPKLSMM